MYEEGKPCTGCGEKKCEPEGDGLCTDEGDEVTEKPTEEEFKIVTCEQSVEVLSQLNLCAYIVFFRYVRLRGEIYSKNARRSRRGTIKLKQSVWRMRRINLMSHAK